MLKGDLITIKNSTRAICRRQGEYEQSMKFSWLEPIACLFHLHMNFQSLLFEKLWGVSRDVISLNRLHGILHRTKVDKVAKHFHHCDDFFHTVIEAPVVALCTQVTDCQPLRSSRLNLAMSSTGLI